MNKRHKIKAKEGASGGPSSAIPRTCAELKENLNSISGSFRLFNFARHPFFCFVFVFLEFGCYDRLARQGYGATAQGESLTTLQMLLCWLQPVFVQLPSCTSVSCFLHHSEFLRCYYSTFPVRTCKSSHRSWSSRVLGGVQDRWEGGLSQQAVGH